MFVADSPPILRATNSKIPPTRIRARNTTSYTSYEAPSLHPSISLSKPPPPNPPPPKPPRRKTPSAAPTPSPGSPVSLPRAQRRAARLTWKSVRIGSCAGHVAAPRGGMGDKRAERGGREGRRVRGEEGKKAGGGGGMAKDEEDEDEEDEDEEDEDEVKDEEGCG
ncbi:hypothetical protein MMC13_006421 [Lambiella insularis]|nr:hypothetical protein [Lambiella insularis]